MEYAQRQARGIIQTLSLDELYELQGWLVEWIAQSELVAKLDKKQSKRREVVRRHLAGATVYQLEMVNCGKCKACGRGARPHGPYWYGYRRENGRQVSWYCGSAPKTRDGQTVVLDREEKR